MRIKRVVLSLVFSSSVLFALARTTDQGVSVKLFRFTKNMGQLTDQFGSQRPDILYSVRSGEMSAYVRNNGVSFQLEKVMYAGAKSNEPERRSAKSHSISISRIDLRFLNANTQPTWYATGPHLSVENFYLDHCSSGLLNVPSFSGIECANLYPGITMVMHFQDNKLKCDYNVAAGADYHDIQIEICGATTIYLDKQGNAVVKTANGNIVQQAPVVFQNGKQRAATWHLEKQNLSFSIP
jgi:hypothetical protein